MAKKSNKTPLVILVLVCACLLYAMYTSLSTLTLAIWGDTVMGTVDRYDNRLDSTNAEPNRSRTVFKGYYFTVKGKGYRGYVIYNSDEAWPRLENGETRAESIRYIPIFPHINKPAALASFSRMGTMGIFYHILTPIGCVLLFWFFLLRPSRDNKKTRARKSAVPQRENKGKVADEFCSACGSKLPKGAAFCVSCGKKVHLK
jgi:ABC-type transport system involved in cytochrome c biogenesis permease subunit